MALFSLHDTALFVANIFSYIFFSPYFKTQVLVLGMYIAFGPIQNLFIEKQTAVSLCVIYQLPIICTTFQRTWCVVWFVVGYGLLRWYINLHHTCEFQQIAHVFLYQSGRCFVAIICFKIFIGHLCLDMYCVRMPIISKQSLYLLYFVVLLCMDFISSSDGCLTIVVILCEFVCNCYECGILLYIRFTYFFFLFENKAKYFSLLMNSSCLLCMIYELKYY